MRIEFCLHDIVFLFGKLVLFGESRQEGIDAKQTSVSITVSEYYPYVLLRSTTHGNIRRPQDLLTHLNSECLPELAPGVSDYPSHSNREEDAPPPKVPFHSIEVCPMLSAVGYMLEPEQILRLRCNPGFRSKAVFELLRTQGFTVMHENWTSESQFMFESKLAFFQWSTVTVSSGYMSPKLSVRQQYYAKSIHAFGASSRDDPPTMRACIVHAFTTGAMVPGPAMNFPRGKMDNFAGGPAQREALKSVACLRFTVGTSTDEDAQCTTLHATTTRGLRDVLHAFFIRHDIDLVLHCPEIGAPSIFDVMQYSPSRINGHQYRAESPFHSSPGRPVLSFSRIMQLTYVSPPFDGFDLQNAVTHPKFGLRPEHRMPFPPTLSDSCYTLRKLEAINGIVQGFQESALCTYARLEDCVTFGQQKRTGTLLQHDIFTNNLFLDRVKLQTHPPIVIRMPESKSSFPDPFQDRGLEAAEHTLPLPANAKPEAPLPKAARGRRDGANCADVDADDDTDDDVVEDCDADVNLQPNDNLAPVVIQRTGGQVREPKAGFYMNDPVCTFDFQSLYPSIMQAYLDTMGYVMDQSILQRDDLRFRYIPISPSESMALVIARRYPSSTLGTGTTTTTTTDHVWVPVPTFIPQLLCTLVQSRKRYKQAMKEATTDARRAMFNIKQNTAKVTQNALYGVFGADTKNPPFKFVPMMVCVTAIGRWMIRTVEFQANCFDSPYRLEVVYGDTDSVMICMRRKTILDSDADPETELSHIYHTAQSFANHCNRDLFLAPNCLDFESMKFPFWLTTRKKVYGAIEYPGGGDGYLSRGSEVQKGFPHIKRGRCLFVQHICRQIMSRILRGREDTIIPFVKERLLALVSHTVSYEELSISSVVKDESEYKNPKAQIQRVLITKIQKRSDRKFASGERITYVILLGNGVVRNRAEDMVYARENRLKLDYSYYLQKQLFKAVRLLFYHHPLLLEELDRLLVDIDAHVDRQTLGTRDIRTFFVT